MHAPHAKCFRFLIEKPSEFLLGIRRAFPYVTVHHRQAADSNFTSEPCAMVQHVFMSAQYFFRSTSQLPQYSSTMRQMADADSIISFSSPISFSTMVATAATITNK